MSAHPLVDVHAHFVTPDYVDAATQAGHVRPDGMPGWPTWSAESHLRLMDEHSIDRAILSISSPGVHFGDDAAAVTLAQHVNDAAAQICAKHPDRFSFFASVTLPGVEDAVIEAVRALDELGAAGVVVETNNRGHYLHEESHAPFLSELDRRGAVLFLHPTSPPGHEHTALGYPRPMLEFLVESTRALTGLIMSGSLGRHQRLRLIASHCGAFLPLMTERLTMFAAAFTTDGPTAEDIESILGRLWYDLAGTPVPTHADTLIRLAGSEHVLYGSDHCWTPAPLVARQIDALDTQWRTDLHGPWREIAAANAADLLTPATVTH